MFNNRNVSHYSAMTLLPLTPVAVLQQLPAMWAEAPPLFPDHRLMPLFKHVENMLMILALTRSLCSGLKQFKSDCFMSERSNGLGFHANLVELEHPSSSTNVALVQFMGLPAGRKNVPLFQVLQFELLVAASWLMLLPAAI